jgi:phospholipid/cholesterol/gamma-HCH transport system substrate-binding protein
MTPSFGGSAFGGSLFGRASRLAGVVAGVIVLALIAATVWVMRPDEKQRHLTVDFPRTVSLYEGSDVRILGVPVGTVESVEPHGEMVRVELSYDAQYDVPADAKAVIISPAIVGDRYVQLAPAYDGGPVMQDGTHLDMAQSEVPLELDEIYQSLDDLSVALGPEGANKNGALSRFVNASAANLDGNGKLINQTLHDLSLLSGTLSDNKEELFGAVAQIEEFVHALKVNDGAVRAFNASLADVSGVLAGERHDLAKALSTLGAALRDVRGFVQDNEEAIGSNVRDLVRVTQILVDQSEAIKESLAVAPLALTNLGLAGDPETGTLRDRDDLLRNVTELTGDPRIALCSLISQDPDGGELCDALGPVLDTVEQLPDVPLGRGKPLGDGGSRKVVDVVSIDTSLADLVRVD